jgi:glycosyltransferase involved in cell wall biosynthesis
MSKSLSVVVPMYNEEENAAQAVLSLQKVLADLLDDFEIIIVESGSTDRTAEIADGLENEQPDVRVIHQISKEGLGSAIRLGMANARKDFVLYIDGDEPFDVAEIATVLPHLEENRIVIGYRIGERENFKRKLFSSVYNWIVQFTLGLGVRDVNFSMKALDRILLRKLDLRADGVFFDAELIAEVIRTNTEIHEIGFEYTPRRSGDSSLDRIPVVISTLWELTCYFVRNRIFRRG